MNTSQENYIKTIYSIAEKSDAEYVNTNSIAEKLEMKASSVTEMLKKFESAEIVNYKKYKGVKLTKKGTSMALNLIRKHRLWEVFLLEKLDFKWDEVHDIAEQLEHIKSKELTDRLDAFLEHPKFDPHGDPIPNADGEITTKDTSVALSNTKEGQSYVISRLMSDDKEFFDFCALNGLKYGNTILVTKQFSKNKMTQIQINNNTILLNEDFTTIIYVNETTN